MPIDANDAVIASRERQERWLKETEKWLRSHTDDGIEVLYIHCESGRFRVQTEAGELAGDGPTIPQALEAFLRHLQIWGEPEAEILRRITRLEGLVLLLAEKQGIDTDGPAARRAISGVRR